MESLGLQASFQIGQHLLGGSITLLRVFAHGANDDIFHALRNVRICAPGCFKRFLQMLQRDADGTFAQERQSSGQHLVQDDAKRIDVRFFARSDPFGMLRRKIMDRTDHGTGLCNGGRSDCTGNAEIRHLHPSVFADQDIVRFDVPMNDLVIMSMIQRIADLRCDFDRFVHLQRRPFPDNFVQIGTIHVFHDDVMGILVLSDIINAHDVRMRQGSRRLRLAIEPLDEILVVYELLTQYLDRNITVQ